MAGPAFFTLSPRSLLCSAAENFFGPTISPSCFNGFDFTLLFEEGIMSIPLSILVLLIAPFRIMQLLKRSEKVLSGPQYILKLVRPFSTMT